MQRKILGVGVAIFGLGSSLAVGCGQSSHDERLKAVQQADIVIPPTPGSEDQWVPVGPAPIQNGLIVDLGSKLGHGIGARAADGNQTTGRGTVVANNPANPLQFWLGTPAAGLWQSAFSVTDNKLVTEPWQLLFEEWPAIGAVVVDPATCSVERCTQLYVGTGEGNLRRQTLYGVGIYSLVYLPGGGEVSQPRWDATKIPGSDAFTGGAVSDIALDKSTGSTRLFASIIPGVTSSGHTATVAHPPPASGYGVFRYDAGATTWVREDVPSGATPNHYLPGRFATSGQNLFVSFGNRGLYRRSLSAASPVWCPLNSGVPVPAGCPTPVASCTGAPAGAPCGLPAPGPDSDPAFERTPLGVAPSDANSIYAAFSDCSRSFTSTESEPISCPLILFRTKDGGTTWTNTNASGVGIGGSDTVVGGSQIATYSWYTGTLAVSATNPDDLLFGGVGLWRSTDGGATFTMPSLGAHPDHHHIIAMGATVGTDPAYLDVNDGGLSIYWANSAKGNIGAAVADNRFPGTQFYSVSVRQIEMCQENPGKDDDCDGDLADDGTECAAGNTNTCNTQIVAGGAQDNGILLFNGGRAWHTLRGGDGMDTIVQDSRFIFNTIQQINPKLCSAAGSTCLNSSVDVDIKTGLNQHYEFPTSAMDLSPLSGDAAMFGPPFIQHEPTKTLFFATDRVYSRAATATTFSPVGGTTRLGTSGAACTGGSTTDQRGTCVAGQVCVAGTCRPYYGDVEQPLAISALAVAKSDVTRLYAGLYDGSVHMLKSGAWTQISPPERACSTATFERPHIPGSFDAANQLRCVPVTSLEVDPANANLVYATYGGFGVAGRHVRRYDDAAATKWTDFSDGELAGSDLPAHVLRINSVTNEMYLGTEDGVYKRKPGGTWVRGYQFPHVPVYSIAIDSSRGRTYAGTHGRGTYLQVKSPTLRVFEGWMASKDCPTGKPCIWDILVYGEGFQPSATGPCRMDILTPSGAVCATGTFDGFSLNPISVNSDTAGNGFGLLGTAGQLVSPDAENRAVIAACFNGKCVSDTKGAPTPITQCEPDATHPTRTISAVQVTCPGNPPVITSVGANCPGLVNPPDATWNPSQFDDTSPTGAALSVLNPSAGAAAAPPPPASTVITLSAVLVADPPAQLCSVSIPYTPSETPATTVLRARDAFNASAACQQKGVTAVIDAGFEKEEDATFDSSRLHLKAPSARGMALHFAVQMGPGLAGTCQTLSDFPGYRRSQLDIVEATITTEATGARGGKIDFYEESPLGICRISVPTQAGDSGQTIANRILAEYMSASTNPKHPSCPLIANPRDLILKDGNLITVAGTGMKVCWNDAGLGITMKPDGVNLLDVPLNQIGILGVESVEVRDRAQVKQGSGFGVVGASGSLGVTLFPDAAVGNTFSVGTVALKDRAQINGNVKTGDIVDRKNQTVITGSISEHATVRLPSISGFQVDYPTTLGSSQTIPPNGTLPLSPGIYNVVTVNSGATLNLSSGTYYFRSLDIEPQAKLRLNEAAGPVKIFIRDGFIFRGTQLTVSGAHPAGYISYLGSGSIFIESAFRGTLVAPSGTLVLRSTTTPHTGAFFGRFVQVVDAGAVVNVVPFTGLVTGSDQAQVSCSDGIRNGDETSVDCGGTKCGASCKLGQACASAADCASAVCTSNVCQASTTCTAASAVDLGDTGHNVTVPNNGCVRVRDRFPSWWNVRNMRLETAANGGYPVPFTWSSACTSSGGSGTFTMDWQSLNLGSTSSACATLIDLKGAGDKNVTLRYWGN